MGALPAAPPHTAHCGRSWGSCSRKGLRGVLPLVMNGARDSEVVTVELTVGALADVANLRRPVAGIGRRMGQKGQAWCGEAVAPRTRRCLTIGDESGRQWWGGCGGVELGQARDCKSPTTGDRSWIEDGSWGFSSMRGSCRYEGLGGGSVTIDIESIGLSHYLWSFLYFRGLRKF
jgi:hypothetical protein